MNSGAHFYRTDFQVHTPRDANWSGARASTEEERHAYAKEFVAECRERSLNAVAITDHHDFAFVPYIRQAAAAESDVSGSPGAPSERLVVFPGLELTLGIPCQALLILDANFPDEKFSAILEALAIQETAGEAEALPPVTRLDHIQSFEDLYTTLDRRPWLQGRYTVLPNVTDGGYGTLMRSGMHAKYKSMPCVGGYLDGTVEAKAKPGSGISRKFGGQDANWGNKRIALFQTSDSRSRTFTDLGKYSSWVKWAEPTAEALRQACLAQESRIAHTQPALPTIYIERVHVSNSSFLGPVDLVFNRQYTAIIGGRGTGKSTILDYIRWCLADNPAVAPTGDGDTSADGRRRELVASTLAAVGGQVEVTFILNGTRHVVRRTGESGQLLLKVGDGEFTAVTEDLVQSLLPVHAYSQKQLSSVAVRPNELTRFITAPILQDLQAKDGQVNDAANRLRQNYGSLQRARSVSHDIERLGLTGRSLSDQAEHLRSLLTGLSAEDQQVLADRPAVETSRETLTAFRRTGEQLTTAMAALLDEVDRLSAGLSQVPPAGALTQNLEAARDAVSGTIDAIRTTVQPAQQALESSLSAGGTLASALSAPEAELTTLDAQYEDVKARSAIHAQQLDQLSSIEERRKATADQLVSLREQLATLGNPEQVHAMLRQELLRLYAERSALLAQQCATVTELSGGLLKAEVVRGRGFQQAEERFRALAAGSGVRAAKFDALFLGLAAETAPLETWERILTELEQLLLLDESTGLTTEQTPTLSRLGLAMSDQERLRTKITVDAWLDLALVPVRDEPTFSYRTNEAQYIRFASASAGQQATALLRVLLSQTGMPLMIDQPEEDLDSQIVQEVVTWLWESKKRRQIIFASHNPNLVVNGDAELVVVCNYRRAGDQSGGHVEITGAIDVKGVRDEITRVMEGGEQAFKLRRDKYGF
ncbi:TrlF family AAA-like ATPase [Pseudonocardia parietis]|uniref:Type III restriction enzyme n=1 Tax=Pseudonocardia parietis TaxID=570936 RepID=A0ABS4W1J3_9PSEU|nr:AAA family ATPase [Pseudonocardia parietis]MBP2369896.1 type III restriction enzyme [Pseudonocardia parietis]